MPEIEDAGRYDVIVIGAGMAGLMAANSLVLQGHHVLLLEKHAAAGGCTMNFERQGFRFEASTHVINGCEAGGMAYEELVKIGAEDRIEFIKVESFGRMVDEARGREFILPWELGEHVEMLGTGPIVYDIIDWSISLTISGSYIFEDDSEAEAKRLDDELLRQEEQLRRNIREDPSPWDEQKQPAPGGGEWKAVDDPEKPDTQPKASEDQPPADNVWQELVSHEQG